MLLKEIVTVCCSHKQRINKPRGKNTAFWMLVQVTYTVELGYNVMKGTVYFVSL